MRVIVPIKQILDPSGLTVNRRAERIFINREEYIINPNDKNALEEALKLKDERGAEVVAVTMGPERADDALREAMAMGADSAFLLTDEAFEKADISVAAIVLGKAIQKIGDYDLIIAGCQAADTGSGQLGPRLAEYLSLPQITEVRELVAADDGKVRAKRNQACPELVLSRAEGRSRRGQGYAEVEASLPALLTVAQDANQPRYPGGAGIINAYREWEVTVWGGSDLVLEAEELQPLTEEKRISFPPERELGAKITGSPKEAAKDLVQHLKASRVI
jgi:electron transfer flavoprotein beta subunit